MYKEGKRFLRTSQHLKDQKKRNKRIHCHVIQENIVLYIKKKEYVDTTKKKLKT